jgi:hypothetical protein
MVLLFATDSPLPPPHRGKTPSRSTTQIRMSTTQPGHFPKASAIVQINAATTSKSVTLMLTPFS